MRVTTSHKLMELGSTTIDVPKYRKAMHKLFRKIDPIQRRSIEMRVYLSAAESKKIKQLAEIRHLSVANYILRAALGKRADIHHNSEVTLALSMFARALRDFHARYDFKNHASAQNIVISLHTQTRDAFSKFGSK